MRQSVYRLAGRHSFTAAVVSTVVLTVNASERVTMDTCLAVQMKVLVSLATKFEPLHRSRVPSVALLVLRPRPTSRWLEPAPREPRKRAFAR